MHLLPTKKHSFSHYQHLPSDWYLCYNRWSYTDIPESPKSIVHIRVHSWCWTFDGFGQVYKDMYIPLKSHTALKTPCVLLLYASLSLLFYQEEIFKTQFKYNKSILYPLLYYNQSWRLERKSEKCGEKTEEQKQQKTKSRMGMLMGEKDTIETEKETLLT